MQQQKFRLAREFEARREHGGEAALGKRKIARPLDLKHAIHLVLRSKKAQGSWNMARSKFEPKITKLVYGLGKRFRIQICEFANSGNHLHLLVKPEAGKLRMARRDFQNFLRTLSSLVARLVTCAKKGKSVFVAGMGGVRGVRGAGAKKQRKFWDTLAYTRLVTLGREFAQVSRYILLNKLETWGIVPTNQRRKFHTWSYGELVSLIPMRNRSISISPSISPRLFPKVLPEVLSNGWPGPPFG